MNPSRRKFLKALPVAVASAPMAAKAALSHSKPSSILSPFIGDNPVSPGARRRIRVTDAGYRKAFAEAFSFSPAQRTLMKLHGTPAKFAKGCYEAVPEYISMREAREAIKKYQKEWDAAK